MPAEGVHLTALREASFVGGLTPPARRCLLRFEAAARLGAIGPDLPYFDRYGEELIRYVARRPARSSPWGARVHGGGAIDLVGVVLDAARRERSELLAALAMGLASHACIDRSIHPLVNALARRFPEGASHDASHREVEKFQSILFHERYFGRDHMGTPGIVRLVQVPARELLATSVGPALTLAFATAAGDGEPARPLRRMARGYEMHARVLGSPLGKRVAPPREKERARPRFLEGPWGTFEGVLGAAIEHSVGVLDAVWGAFEAPERDADAARAHLDAALPPGSIEGQGRDIDLDRAFVTRPPSEIAA
ncbi:MAG: zinc dependent phospholipase C family protein [Myxococcales bacterium]|nr:zinc dependent phospholipase C family protein [Myxococcales bacterium]